MDTPINNVGSGCIVLPMDHAVYCNSGFDGKLRCLPKARSAPGVKQQVGSLSNSPWKLVCLLAISIFNFSALASANTVETVKRQPLKSYYFLKREQLPSVRRYFMQSREARTVTALGVCWMSKFSVGTAPRRSRRDIRNKLNGLAQDVNTMEIVLRQNRYPELSWKSQMTAYERKAVKSIARGGNYRSLAFKRKLAQHLDLFRKSNKQLKLKRIQYSEDGCGADGVIVSFASIPSGASIKYLPLGDYRLCLSQGLPVDQCNWSAYSGTEDELSGRYMVRASWPNGAVTLVATPEVDRIRPSRNRVRTFVVSR